jgi:CubicO group peptidase (beta-lactamase class C family)
LVTVAAFILLWAVTTPILAAQTDFGSVDLDAVVHETMSRWEVPGVVLVLVHNGEAVVRGYGTRVVGEERPVDSATLVQIASHTKAVTATALAMLVSEGGLSWDDPVRMHIPEFSLADPRVGELLSVRDLVSHRGGLPAPPIGGFRNAAYSIESLLDTLRTERGDNFRKAQIYSQPGIALAGEVVARVSGMPWETFVRERIFAPLGMVDSYTSNTDLLERFGAPSGEKNVFMSARKRGGTVTAGDWSGIGTTPLYAPAGGITTTGADMAKWISFLLGDGDYSDAIAETLRPLIPLDPLLRTFTDPIAPLGTATMGWNAVTHEGRVVYFAPGGWMSCAVALVPDADLGVGVFTNAYFYERHSFESLFPVYALAMQVIDLELGAVQTDWNKVFAEALARPGS